MLYHKLEALFDVCDAIETIEKMDTFDQDSFGHVVAPLVSHLSYMGNLYNIKTEDRESGIWKEFRLYKRVVDALKAVYTPSYLDAKGNGFEGNFDLFLGRLHVGYIDTCEEMGLEPDDLWRWAGNRAAEYYERSQ